MKTFREIKIQFETYLSLCSISILSIGTSRRSSPATSPKHRPYSALEGTRLSKAERAIRTLKETASANELHAKGLNNLRLLANEKATGVT